MYKRQHQDAVPVESIPGVHHKAAVEHAGGQVIGHNTPFFFNLRLHEANGRGIAGGGTADGGEMCIRDSTDTLSPQALPAFLPETERLLSALRSLSRQELKQLWRCSDAITDLNVERLARMELGKGLTPALLSYQGIQYQYMAPGVFETGQFTYLQEHLRILSGFYGMLRPFDGVTPYRLEMQARLSVNGCPDLYAFWGDRLARALAGEAGLVVDLASQEYSLSLIHISPSVWPGSAPGPMRW